MGRVTKSVQERFHGEIAPHQLQRLVENQLIHEIAPSCDTTCSAAGQKIARIATGVKSPFDNDGSAPKKQQTITLTNDNPIDWYIYASPIPSELTYIVYIASLANIWLQIA